MLSPCVRFDTIRSFFPISFWGLRADIGHGLTDISSIRHIRPNSKTLNIIPIQNTYPESSSNATSGPVASWQSVCQMWKTDYPVLNLLINTQVSRLAYSKSFNSIEGICMVKSREPQRLRPVLHLVQVTTNSIPTIMQTFTGREMDWARTEVAN